MSIKKQIMFEIKEAIKRSPYIPYKELIIQLKWDYIGLVPMLMSDEEFNNFIEDTAYELYQYSRRKRRKI